MPISSFTGKPGNGKTLLMIEHMAANVTLATRPIFAAGIDGLRPGVATILADPRQWNAVRPGERCSCHDTEDSAACDAHVVPNGSIIYVDEAWKWFGHLTEATRQATPPHVMQLAEHRHRGIDFVWTFQGPRQIYPFARELMADHHHVVRRFGSQLVDVFSWEELNEEVKSAAKREAAQRKTRMLPKEFFDWYKSAEVHTIKMKLPWKVMAIPVFVVAAVLAGWFAYSKLKPDSFAASMSGKSPASGAAAQGVAGLVGSEKPADAPRYASAYEYAKVHLPRIGVMPWTAELFDGREFTADPEIFCLSSLPGQGGNGERIEDPTCTCLTEQGTAYDLSQPECRTIARRGPVYNPYRERTRESGQRLQESAREPRPALTAFTGSVIAGEATAVGSRGLVPGPGHAKPPLVVNSQSSAPGTAAAPVLAP